MRKTLLTTLILLAFAPMAYAADAKPAAAPAATDANKNKPVAVVNGKEIPATYAEIMKREMIAQGQPDNEQLDTRVRESLINMEILSRAAIDLLNDAPRRAAISERFARMQHELQQNTAQKAADAVMPYIEKS